MSLLRNDDPLFKQLLAAGSAWVVVPVRPGFEALMDYFLLTGQIWGGGSLPSITDSTYLSIAQEVRDSSGARGDEQPVGDPMGSHHSWQVSGCQSRSSRCY